MSGAAEPTAKRAKADEEEDPLVRRKEEVVRLLEKASAKGKSDTRAKKELLELCERLEAKNEKLLRRLPPEMWQKILDENLDQNDFLAVALTCRFFREKQKDLGKKVETKLAAWQHDELRKSGKMPSHSLGWFRWFCDTFKILPGFEGWEYERVKGAVYEGDLVNYAAFQGSVEILRWLMKEKGWELNGQTGFWAGMGGAVEVLLEYLKAGGYEFDEFACDGAAMGGRLEALEFLRGLDPPCPWDEDTCFEAARGGQLEVLKWARSQDPPCPWDEDTCLVAAGGGHLEVLKWARSQDPPCPWSRSDCRRVASESNHQHIVKWIDQQEDESDEEDSEYGPDAWLSDPDFEDWMYSDTDSDINW